MKRVLLLFSLFIPAMAHAEPSERAPYREVRTQSGAFVDFPEDALGGDLTFPRLDSVRSLRQGFRIVLTRPRTEFLTSLRKSVEAL